MKNLVLFITATFLLFSFANLYGQGKPIVKKHQPKILSKTKGKLSPNKKIFNKYLKADCGQPECLGEVINPVGSANGFINVANGEYELRASASSNSGATVREHRLQIPFKVTSPINADGTVVQLKVKVDFGDYNMICSKTSNNNGINSRRHDLDFHVRFVKTNGQEGNTFEQGRDERVLLNSGNRDRTITENGNGFIEFIQNVTVGETYYIMPIIQVVSSVDSGPINNILTEVTGKVKSVSIEVLFKNKKNNK